LGLLHGARLLERVHFHKEVGSNEFVVIEGKGEKGELSWYLG
jgi:hypothetical protein